jgi:hypothetical protein
MNKANSCAIRLPYIITTEPDIISYVPNTHNIVLNMFKLTAVPNRLRFIIPAVSDLPSDVPNTANELDM